VHFKIQHQTIWRSKDKVWLALNILSDWKYVAGCERDNLLINADLLCLGEVEAALPHVVK